MTYYLINESTGDEFYSSPNYDTIRVIVLWCRTFGLNVVIREY